MTHTPTVAEVVQAINPLGIPMPDMLGTVESRRIQELFPEFIDEALNALGESNDSEYLDLHLAGSDEIVDIVQALISHDATCVALIMATNRREVFNLEEFPDGAVSFSALESAMVRRAATAVTAAWADAFRETGEDLEIEIG